VTWAEWALFAIIGTIFLTFLLVVMWVVNSNDPRRQREDADEE
jgi:hypothetical protein